MAQIDRKISDLQAEFYRALASSVRLEILELISSSKELNCSQLLDALKIPKANLSQHLTVLKDAGILKFRKDGQFQYVSLAIPEMLEACKIVRSLLLVKLENEMNEIKMTLDQHKK